MTDLIIRNYEQTKEEILVDYDKGSFYENWQQNETWEISFTVDLVQVMTDGGPGRATNVLVYQIYNEAFKKFDFGYASAISLVLFVIVLGVTVVQFSWNKRRT